ncbi:MAG: ATP-binding protein [Ruminiclostridium sp.]
MEKKFKKENFLDEGKVNIGYTFEEAIMEAIDDSFDAKADNIQIKLLDDIFTEFKEPERIDNASHDNDTMARRSLYVVCDNGIGIQNIEGVFNFGNKEKTKYRNKEEYLTKNSRFHYGVISHINVAAEVTFYSKTERDNQWNCITLNYNCNSDCGYVSNVREMTENEKGVLRVIGIKLPKQTGAILYVRGVHKTEFDYREIDKIRLELIQQLGKTYYYDLNLNNNISVDDIIVKPLNPLGEDLTDDLIKPYIFAKYEISLNEILNKLDDNINNEEIFMKFANVFESKEEMLSETIKIKLVAININFTNAKDKIIIKYPNLDDIYFPSLGKSGFYIKRNKRYIGKTLGIFDLVSHGSCSRFRGEISFNPIFDEFFKIQINKNRNTLSKTLISLIKERIEEDSNLKGSSAAAKIRNALGEENISDAQENSPKNTLENGKDKLNKKIIILKRKLESCFQDIQQINELETILQKENLMESELNDIREKYTQIDMEYNKFNNDIFKDMKSLLKRVSYDTKRKFLTNSVVESPYVNILSSVREPLQEGELYGIFYLLYTMFPDVNANI